MDANIAYEYLTGKRKFDPAKAQDAALRCAEEGIVLLTNGRDANGKPALPLEKSERIAFFGRMQKHYLMLGTGSGGRVRAPFCTNIFDSLRSLGAELDKNVESFYDTFVAMHPYDSGNGWTHPASQTEPELTEEFVSNAAKNNETALCVITRTAGEDCDLKYERGGFLLTETELNDLKLIRNYFSKLVVLLNVCSVIDLKEIDELEPDAICLLWNGGMMGGLAAARVLLGISYPSGKLGDTVAYDRTDYPAYDNFGNTIRNCYAEDIYVGYRYFSTFANGKVLFPFGHGETYTEFDIITESFKRAKSSCLLEARVTNTGCRAGKEVVQCYVEQPNGALGKPKRVLAAFAKTPELAPGQSVVVTLGFKDEDIASYDESRSRFVLEAGKYAVYAGSDLYDVKKAGEFVIEDEICVRQCESALSPVYPFDRLINDNGNKKYSPVTLRVNREEPIPAELPAYSGDEITFDDVADGKASLADFVSRLSDEELMCMVRGEGMSSPKVTPGTAAAFAGVTPGLRARGVPVLCCTDGPSGIRMVSDVCCTAFPSATCLASTWNTGLVEEAYEHCGAELASYCVDMLLGPGVNIHRDPLCGRNFEYFSEDPLLAGKMASAVCRGLGRAGVSGVIKHYLANNQETNRHGADSVISERAVREIYSRPFAICAHESPVKAVMTSYNPVNGSWAASNYDLVTRILRNDIGFTGFVMTDWWARVDDGKGSHCTTNLASMVHAGNDVYMVTADSQTHEDNLAQSLAEGKLTRGELQACAMRICAFALQSLSYIAQRSGYGVRDLKAECENTAPVCTCVVTEGKALFNSVSSRKAIVKIEYVSNTAPLTQTNVAVKLNDKSAFSLLVGGTGGKPQYDHREISLGQGENKLRFYPESSEVSVISVEIY